MIRLCFRLPLVMWQNAQGMTRIARAAGVWRESLYKSLQADGAPSFKTISKVAQALGVRLVFEPTLPAEADQKREGRFVNV
jgi:DNA-binding phage protein